MAALQSREDFPVLLPLELWVWERRGTTVGVWCQPAHHSQRIRHPHGKSHPPASGLSKEPPHPLRIEVRLQGGLQRR